MNEISKPREFITIQCVVVPVAMDTTIVTDGTFKNGTIMLRNFTLLLTNTYPMLVGHAIIIHMIWFHVTKS